MRSARTFLALTFVLLVTALILAGSSLAVAQTEKMLHVFKGPSIPNGSGYPNGGLIADAAGNLYGTTAATGNSCSGGACGTVFELSPTGSGGYTQTVLHVFSMSGTKPWNPQAGLAMDASGNLYGTTYAGGLVGAGAVFKLTYAAGSWTGNVLYSFGGPDDGAQPVAALTLDAAGNVYGTTQTGGRYGEGVVFQLSPNQSGSWSERILHAFKSHDGSNPQGALIFDSLGNLYGTTQGGGANGEGAAFELSPSVAGPWTEKVIYSFASAPGPQLTMDAAGNLYGTTSEFGTANAGFVFELTPASGTWSEQVIYNFCSEAHCAGGFGSSGVVIDPSGNLYGTTAGGAAYAEGAAYELSPPAPGGSSWTHTVLHAFGNKTDGAQPSGTLLYNTGKLFGATLYGGKYGYGTVFQITP
jgi:uncharacterized repeat protein (TIGR03803 family)